MIGQFGNIIVKNSIAIKTVKKFDDLSEHKHIKFAGKVLKTANSELQKNMIKNECEALKHINSLNNSYFPKFYGCSEDEHNYYINMQYIDGITLNKLFLANKLDNIYYLSRQICEIFMLLFENQIVYLDFNKENFIINLENYNITLIDWGITCGNFWSCDNDFYKIFFSKNANYDYLSALMIKKAIILACEVAEATYYSYKEPSKYVNEFLANDMIVFFSKNNDKENESLNNYIDSISMKEKILFLEFIHAWLFENENKYRN